MRVLDGRCGRMDEGVDIRFCKNVYEWILLPQMMRKLKIKIEWDKEVSFNDLNNLFQLINLYAKIVNDLWEGERS